MIPFIITVDTEGDNLWNWKPGKNIDTENALYIPRFQELCEKYNMKPVYLTNYEMTMDSRFVSYMKPKAVYEKCEIGMHCHAWNSPPTYEIKHIFSGNPYITEYPQDVMFEKMKFMTDFLQNTFEQKMTSHRAGRWASNETMFRILSELGYTTDCSWVTGMDMSSLPGATISKGFNYKHVRNRVYKANNGVLEVPMSAMQLHHTEGPRIRSKAKHLLVGENVWLRPATTNTNLLIRIIDNLIKSKAEYIEFMIHSSELMPNGSPYCRTNEQVEVFYEKIETIFKYIVDKCESRTLSEFAATFNVHRSE